MKKTWFITGASRGFGRIWAEAALRRGDHVTATARNLADVADLKTHFGNAVLPLALDVTNSEQVKQVVEQAYTHFGRLDVLVNNAGTSLLAATEEASDEQIRDIFEANYIGMVRVLRAALPLLRKQRSGHILGVSSGLGITSMPLIGFYCATKWAVEGMHEALAQEVKAFGIKVTIVEPGAYATDFGKSAKISDVLEPYADFRKQLIERLSTMERGDPQATSEAILKLVDTENPPLRLGLGTTILPRARAAYAERIATWEAWEDVANAAMGEPKVMDAHILMAAAGAKGGSMAEVKENIEQAYSAFNRRDIDGALALMTEDVNWPKASEGGTVRGKAEIRAYWTRQWREFDGHVEPVEITKENEGKIRVRVHQLVKNLQGELLSDSEVLHLFTMSNGLIAAMELGDVVDASGPTAAFARRS